MMCTLILHRLSRRSVAKVDTARTSLRMVGLAALLLTAFAPGAFAQTFGGSNPITISGTLDVSEGSTVSVSGLSSTVTDISLTFTNLNVTNLNSVAAVLVPPSGSGLPALDLLSGVCGSVNQQIGNSTFTMVSSGASGVDNLNGMIPYFGGTCPSTFSGSYVPTDYYPGQDTFNSPGPSSYVSGGIGSPGTTNCNNDFPSTQCGTYNFDTAFELPANGASLNGTWTLYIANEAGTGQFTPSGSLGSWSITFTTENAASTTTSVSAGPDGTTSLVYTNSNVDGQPTTGTPVTVTATVSPNPGGGTVTFYDSTGTSAGSGTVLASAVAVNSLGEAQTTVTFTGFEEGSRTLSAAYGGVAGQYTGSTSGLVTVLTTNHPYNPSGATFCNGPIKINDNSGGTPYPSLLTLGTGFSQLQGTIESVTVTLNNVNLQNGVDLDDLGLMLQAPGNNTTGLASSGNAFEFLSWAGNPYTSGTLTISDTGTAQIPYDMAPPCTNCLPTDNYLDIGSDNSDSFPGPAPATFGKPAPTGSSTFTTEFGGQGANNTWSLYADNRLIEGGTLGTIGSWCLNFTMQANAHPTAMTVNGSPNPASITSGTTANVSLTATISVTDSSGLTVNAGTVTFVDGSTNLGTVAVSNGVATLNNVALTEGTHQIVATYSGTNTGTEFGISSKTFDQRVDSNTTIPVSASGATGPYSYCNSGAITAPGLGFDAGAATPYPSNIFVTGLPGTVNGVSVSLKNFSTRDQGDLMSMLVGPGGNNFDFFSLTGSNVSNTPPPINITFVDTASSRVEGNLVSSGSFMPTSLNTDITYPQCPANASLCATENVGPPLPSNPFTPTHKAASAGTAVLGNPDEAGVFGGTTSSTYNGNGTWSLYIDDGGPTGGGEQTSVGGGWCVNLTVNLPTIALSSQSPSTFVQGGTGSLPQITVTNNGPGPIGDPTQTNANAMTVTDTLPTGLTYSGSTGTDWSCSASGQTVVCRNEDMVAANGTYSPLTINVNVSNTASGPIGNNAVSVSDGVAANTPSPTSAAITIDVPPAINSANNTTISQGAALNFSVTSTGYPTPVTLTVSNVQNPIPGITIPMSSSMGTLMLTGTPTASGTSTFTITASNGVSPDATQDFTLTVDAPPTVTTTAPANSATGVSPTSTVSFTFNKAVNVTASAFTLQCPSGKSRAFKLSPAPPGGTTSFTLTPSANLPYGVTCTATAVASQIADLFGTPLATNYSFSFSTITLTPATLSSPSGGSVLAGPTVTFNWAAPPSATGYGLRLGTTVGGNNLWSSGQITATTATAKGLPTDGSTVYVRLYTAYGSVDVYKDYTFTAATRAALTSPAGETTLAGPSVAFDWTTAAGATGYAIRFGTTVGGNNIWSSGPITTTSATAKALPTNGGTVYARLYTAYGSTEVYTDYTFTAATRAALTSPLGGSVLTGTTETFNWTTVAGATGYAIRFGTTVGGNDIWSSGPITTTSATAKKLPTNGTTVYARLYTAYGSTEVYTDYTFTASTAP